jgi:hypothetical protein
MSDGLTSNQCGPNAFMQAALAHEHVFTVTQIKNVLRTNQLCWHNFMSGNQQTTLVFELLSEAFECRVHLWKFTDTGKYITTRFGTNGPIYHIQHIPGHFQAVSVGDRTPIIEAPANSQDNELEQALRANLASHANSDRRRAAAQHQNTEDERRSAHQIQLSQATCELDDAQTEYQNAVTHEDSTTAYYTGLINQHGISTNDAFINSKITHSGNESRRARDVRKKSANRLVVAKKIFNDLVLK